MYQWPTAGATAASVTGGSRAPRLLNEQGRLRTGEPGPVGDGLCDRTGWVMPQTRVTGKDGKSARWQARRHEIVDVSAKVFAGIFVWGIATRAERDGRPTGRARVHYPVRL